MLFENGCKAHYCRLIRAEPNWTHWTQQAESLHGISRELLFSNGVGVNQISSQLNQILAARDTAPVQTRS